mgnify:CR=1 FL=1
MKHTSRFALAAGVVGGLLALEAKHVFHCAVSFLYNVGYVHIVPVIFGIIHRKK